MLIATKSRPRPRTRKPPPAAWLHAALAGMALIAFLAWMWSLDRPFLCPCGAVRIWAPEHDSQQLADWYSLLHVSFGIGLFALVNRFQPGWPAERKLLAAMLGSLAWEAIENAPGTIALFNAPGAVGSYSGDTTVNALGDTIFVLAGFALAGRASVGTSLLVLVSIEALVGWAIGDGLLVGTARLLLAHLP